MGWKKKPPPQPKNKRQVLRENFLAKMRELGKCDLRADDLFYMGKAVCEGLVDSEIRADCLRCDQSAPRAWSDSAKQKAGRAKCRRGRG